MTTLSCPIWKSSQFNQVAFSLLQCLVALGVVAFGVINVAGELKEIRVTAELEKQSFETVWNNPSFYSFNHRGKALFGEWIIRLAMRLDTFRFIPDLIVIHFVERKIRCALLFGALEIDSLHPYLHSSFQIMNKRLCCPSNAWRILSCCLLISLTSVSDMWVLKC